MHPRHQYQALDALRWIAAFSVGMGHAFLCFDIRGTLPAGPAYAWTMVFNGAYAVDLFFVLSGFVLINATRTLSLRNYLAFVVRRAARIYPAAWMSLGLAVVCLVLVHGTGRFGEPWVSGWVEWLIEPPRWTLPSVLGSLALTNDRLNPVLWTIATELVASAFYPLLVPMVRQNRRRALLVAILAGVVLSGIVPGGTTLFDALHFLYMFMVGASLNLLRAPDHRRAAAVLLLEAVVLMLLTRAFGQQHSFLADFFSTLSAAMVVGIVAFCRPPMVEKFLGHRTMVALGQSSYSYYLINAPVLYLMVNAYPLAHLRAPGTDSDYVLYSLVAGLAAALVTAPLAMLSARTLESFSIRMGRRLEAAIAGAAA